MSSGNIFCDCWWMAIWSCFFAYCSNLRLTVDLTEITDQIQSLHQFNKVCALWDYLSVSVNFDCIHVCI